MSSYTANISMRQDKSGNATVDCNNAAVIVFHDSLNNNQSSPSGFVPQPPTSPNPIVEQDYMTEIQSANDNSKAILKLVWNASSSGTLSAAKRVCCGLSQLTLTTEQRQMLCEGGIFTALAGLLTKFCTNDEAMAQWGCAAVVNLVCDATESNAAVIGERQIIKALVDVLSCHGANDLHTARYACHAISKLASKDDNRVHLIECGAGKQVLSVLMEYATEDNLLVQFACLAIAKMVKGNVNNVAVTLGEYGACEALASVVTQHWIDSFILFTACECICMIAHSCEKKAIRFGNGGMCELLTTALQRLVNRDMEIEIETKKKRNRIDCFALIECLCSAISTLALPMENKKRFRKANACSLLVNILSAYGKEHPKIARKAALAIATLALNCQETSGALGDAGACKVLAEFLVVCGTALLPNVFQAIEHLAQNKANNILFCELDTCQQVAKALMEFGKDESIAIAGCKAVNQLAQYPLNCAKLGEFGACNAVVETMFYIGNERAIPFALESVATLALNQDNCKLFANTMACFAVVTGMREFGSKDKSVALASCHAMTNLATCKKNSSKLVSEKGHRALYALLETYGKSDAAIALHVCEAVISLACNSSARFKLNKIKMAELLETIPPNASKHSALNMLKKKWFWF
jgi:hypothetical protein